MTNDNLIIEPPIKGDKAEDFVQFFSRRTFLKPWVFKSPKIVKNNKELTDIAVLFMDTIVLIQVKGNKFDPNNPQRYLYDAKARHRQLKGAERTVLSKTGTVKFTNEYLSFEKLYLVAAL